MTFIERNKKIGLAYVEAMNAGDFEELVALFSPDAKIHGVTGAGGLDFALPIWKQLHSGLNMRLEVLDIVADDGRVAMLYREHGRWTGPFLGYSEPSGRTYELVALEWFEVSEGKIVNRWAARDAASQARQVGFPEAAGPASATGKAA